VSRSIKTVASEYAEARKDIEESLTMYHHATARKEGRRSMELGDTHPYNESWGLS